MGIAYAALHAGFLTSQKLLQPLNNLLMAASFSELLPRSFVLRHIHCQTLCSNFEEWVAKSPVPFGSFLGKPTLQRFPI